MVMVPRNSTAEGFAYIRQSKRVMIAIKTERTQIHFLSDVLVAVVSLDLKVSNGSLRRRRNLIAVSNVCEAAPRFLFDAPNGPNESVIGRAFGFPFNSQPEQANHGEYSTLVQSRGPEGPEVQPRLVCEALWHRKLFCWVWYLELDSDLSRFDYEYEFSSTSESLEFPTSFILRIITLSCC